MSEPSLSLATRLWFAFVGALRILVDGRFAWRVWSVRDALPQAPPASAEAKPAAKARPAKQAAPRAVKQEPAKADLSPALVLLSLLQREGRLVDFLEQEITSFDDAEIGAAVRVVHEGCRKVLRAHASVSPIREEEEESRVEVVDGLETGATKLTGNVSGDPPYRGVLRHRGWRIADLTLPTPVAGHDVSVVAPAEVEL